MTLGPLLNVSELLTEAEESLDYQYNDCEVTYALADFLDAARRGYLNEDDGIGIYMDDAGNSLGSVWLNDVPRNATKVNWYNK